jgi:cell division protein FtsB
MNSDSIYEPVKCVSLEAKNGAGDFSLFRQKFRQVVEKMASLKAHNETLNKKINSIRSLIS